MTANQAIEIINNAQNYSEHEYNFAIHQVREWKRHSEELRDIQAIDNVVSHQSVAWSKLEDTLIKAIKSDETKDYLKPFYQGFLGSMDDVYKEIEGG